MSTIPLRTDYDATGARAKACRSGDPNQVRRLLAIAAGYDGMNRADAAAVGSMDRQSLSDWVHGFIADGSEDLQELNPPGAVPKLTEAEQAELATVVEAGPHPPVDVVVRWRRIDFKEVIRDRFGQDYHKRSVSRLLHELGSSQISARPRHPGQDPEMLETCKNRTMSGPDVTAPPSVPRSCARPVTEAPCNTIEMAPPGRRGQGTASIPRHTPQTELYCRRPTIENPPQIPPSRVNLRSYHISSYLKRRAPPNFMIQKG